MYSVLSVSFILQWFQFDHPSFILYLFFFHLSFILYLSFIHPSFIPHSSMIIFLSSYQSYPSCWPDPWVSFINPSFIHHSFTIHSSFILYLSFIFKTLFIHPSLVPIWHHKNKCLKMRKSCHFSWMKHRMKRVANLVPKVPSWILNLKQSTHMAVDMGTVPVKPDLVTLWTCKT